jgi:hypothetical protein
VSAKRLCQRPVFSTRLLHAPLPGFPLPPSEARSPLVYCAAWKEHIDRLDVGTLRWAQPCGIRPIWPTPGIPASWTLHSDLDASVLVIRLPSGTRSESVPHINQDVECFLPEHPEPLYYDIAFESLTEIILSNQSRVPEPRHPFIWTGWRPPRPKRTLPNLPSV